jgi:hypothetical protein
MSELEQALRDLRNARQTKNDSKAELLQAMEQSARLDKDLENAHRQSQGQALEQIRGAQKELNERVKSLQSDYFGSKGDVHGQLYGLFEQFGKPQDLIKNWDDHVPILLFPVRLETRFVPHRAQQIPSFMGEVGELDLLIRVFPDEASVVQHDPILTEKEVAKGKIFWLETWKAADDAARLSAWQAFVNGTNSHRAAWIARRTKPFNLDDLDATLLIFPKKEDLTTVSDAEYAAGKAYWRAHWMANQNTEGAANAITQLAKTVGQARAEAVAKATRPTNFGQLSKMTPSDFFKEMAQNTLEPSEVTPKDNWRQATYAEVLPDKFVFIGYSGGVKIFETLGQPVADRVAMSPDPKGVDSKIERDANGNLQFNGDVAWVKDFETAVGMGLGIRIALPSGIKRLDRLIVTGLNLVDGADGGVDLLEKLFQNHRYAPQGMAFVPTGTPTNNTDGSSTAFIGELSAEESFKVEMGVPLFTTNAASNAPFYGKPDGQRLAEALGVTPSVFQHIHQSDRQERAESQAMNVALWNATLGYYLPQMLKPLVDRPTTQHVFDFFTTYVSGRGSLPTLRIGSQPYGILPTTDFQKWTLTEAEMGNNGAFHVKMLGFLKKFDTHWKSLIGFTPRINANSTTPDADFLSVIGLDGGSVSYAHRMLLERRMSRMIYWTFFGLDILPAEFKTWQQRADTLIAQLGISETPEIAQHDFGRLELLDAVPVVEDEPLSESAPVKPFFTDKTTPEKSVNYLKWLRTSDTTAIENQVFKNEKNEVVPKPATLLYIYLRHAIQQSTWDAVISIFEKNKVVNAAARYDQTTRNIRQAATAQTTTAAVANSARDFTKEDYLDARVKDNMPNFPIVGNPTFREYIGQNARLLPLKDTNLPLIIDALAKLENLPTARLERLFAEHMDTCSYRLDAWIDGVIQRRLEFLRPQRRFRNEEEVQSPRGTYLAAFGWLENIENKTEGIPISTEILPTELRNTDPSSGTHEGPIFENAANGGFVHAPSLNHATTAALLRNGYLTHSNPADKERLTVNLSSERVRKALFYLEGIRNGQELAALLGYDFERRLHDGNIDTYIYRFRDTFPFKILQKDTVEAGKTLDVVAARNVVDGYALVEAVRKGAAYPYGVAELPLSNSLEDVANRAKIEAAVNALQDAMDAIADVTLSESVHQFVQGNHASGGASLKMIQEGHYPSIPDVVQTPRSGNSLTHRMAINFNANAVAPANPSPRSIAEPAVNEWLTKAFKDILKDVKVPVRLTKTNAAPAPPTVDDSQVIDLKSLKLQPIDLVFLVENQLKDLEKRLLYQFRNDPAKAAEPAYELLEILITKRTTVVGDVSFGEVMPMLRQVHDLLSKARPLNAIDYRVPSESKPSDPQNVGQWAISELKTRVETLMTGFKTDLLDPLSTRHDALATLLENKVTTDAQKLVDVKTYILNPAHKWEEAFIKAAGYDLADAYPSSAFHLNKPEVAAGIDGDLSIKTAVEDLKQMFSPQFFGAPNALFTFNFLANTISLKRVLVKKMDNAIAAKKRAEAPSVSVDEQVKHLTDAAKALLGSAFVLVPHFRLENTVEVSTAFGNRDKLFDFKTKQVQTTPPSLSDATCQNLIIEEWLQGIARVRNRMGGVERLKMAAETLTDAPDSSEAMALTPVQVPYLGQKHWVALDMPETFEDLGGKTQPSVDRDYLSFTVMNLPNAPDFSQPQCGLMLDAWTELVPNRTETTGVVAHHNQPNSEPAQCLLLAISPTLTGAWTWDNLLGTLNDTLNRAKTRAVEPDTLNKHSLFAQLLPAVTTATEKGKANMVINFSALRTEAFAAAVAKKLDS